MIIEILTWLSRAIESSPLIAIGASFLWGIASIVLSPCHLASIPLIIGYIDEQGQITVRRAFWLSVLFASGILITISLVGLITALAGRMLGDIGAIGNYVVAVIFFVIGLHLLGVIPLPWSGSGGRQIKHKGMLGAFIIGLLFGLALGPCTFAYMAPMLGVVFKVAAEKMLFAVALLLAYGIGHCLLIVLAGSLTETVAHYLHWTEKSKTAAIVKKICGVLVILGGIYLIITS
ncbi:cytochrome C biogenesis protein [candidate division WOR-3 bacterium RBG_13_43_14]|uniref:Cytochrome C biogenesis protein n=1 Tax=candidate division WOR-3 bacterium RBG_13_43_14 TaxID=1802590 RepID=A0A1F4UEM0_UNCW3|nr:MAG: cytochrome C biogenesis protein [candidate division WOR-3 bacterium RBG_13_43_14]